MTRILEGVAVAHRERKNNNKKSIFLKERISKNLCGSPGLFDDFAISFIFYFLHFI